jgi:hypothetical protein
MRGVPPDDLLVRSDPNQSSAGMVTRPPGLFCSKDRLHCCPCLLIPQVPGGTDHSLCDQPRSGERSVAHGVSRGITRSDPPQPRRGETLSLRRSCFAALRLNSHYQTIPTARAVGYRSFAAPRLWPFENNYHRLKSVPPFKPLLRPVRSSLVYLRPKHASQRNHDA